MANPTQPQSTPPAKKSGYGKRPLWQWFLIYLVIAVIAYVAIYYLFIHHSSSGGSGTLPGY